MNEEHDIGPADEQALRELFAALVADAAPSEQSPLQVQRLARAEQQAGAERRARRLTYTRNALVAAVLIGIVALVAPRLVSSSSSTATAASSSSSSAAGAVTTAAAASAGAYGGAAAAPQSAGDRSSAAASAAGGGAASSAAAAPAASAAATEAATSAGMSSGSSAASSTSAAAAASSASSAASSAPASSGAASSAGPADCLPAPARAVGAVRAALPGYRGTVTITTCPSGTSTGSGTSPGPVAGTTTFVLAGRTPASSCSASSPCSSVAGTPLPGTKDAYGYRDGVVVVGANGVTVTVTTTPGGPSRSALVAAARALLRTLG